jgi:transposase
MPFTPADRYIIQAHVLQDGIGARKIKDKYPDKDWTLSALSALVKKIRETGSIERRNGSGRPRSVRTGANIVLVREIVDQTERGTLGGASTRAIARRIRVSRSSVRRILRLDLRLRVYKLERVHDVTRRTAEQRVVRCTYLSAHVTSYVQAYSVYG